MMKLSLPFEHTVIGMITTSGGVGGKRTFVAVQKLGWPNAQSCSTHEVMIAFEMARGVPCEHGHYDMTHAQAMTDMVQRAMTCDSVLRGLLRG